MIGAFNLLLVVTQEFKERFKELGLQLLDFTSIMVVEEYVHGFLNTNLLLSFSDVISALFRLEIINILVCKGVSFQLAAHFKGSSYLLETTFQ